MKPNLRLINIKVEDIETMEQFYTQLLQKEPSEVEAGRLIEYKFDGVLLGLYDPSADPSVDNNFRRGDNVIPAFKLGADYEQEKERVNSIVGIEYEAEENGHRWFTFRDPEGNTIEMYEGSLPEQ